MHLDGRGIRIEVKKGERVIRHDEELVIRSEGMPIRGTGRKGDLYVKFAVEMPGESWASRQDVVDGVSDFKFLLLTLAYQIEHESRAARPTARNGAVTGDCRYSLPGAAQIKRTARKESVSQHSRVQVVKSPEHSPSIAST